MKTELKHTAEEWFDKNMEKYTGIKSRHYAIQMLNDFVSQFQSQSPVLIPSDEEKANAKLIAAAPELLKALNEMEKSAIILADCAPSSYKNQHNDLFANVHNAHLHAINAINKATS